MSEENPSLILLSIRRFNKELDEMKMEEFSKKETREELSSLLSRLTDWMNLLAPKYKSFIVRDFK
jgi:hypothetical protein